MGEGTPLFAFTPPGSGTPAFDVARERTVICLSRLGHITKCQSWEAPRTFCVQASLRTMKTPETTAGQGLLKLSDWPQSNSKGVQVLELPNPLQVGELGLPSASSLPSPLPAQKGIEEVAPQRREPIAGKRAGEASPLAQPHRPPFPELLATSLCPSTHQSNPQAGSDPKCECAQQLIFDGVREQASWPLTPGPLILHSDSSFFNCVQIHIT